jgi:hypothetical protein
MPTPSRYSNGITTVPKSNPLGMFGLPDPTEWHTYFDDFDTYTAADWTITLVGTTPTAALTDINGGALLLTMAATDDSSLNAQKVGESFLLTAGKRTFFKARLKVSDATQSDFLIGLAVLDTTLQGAVSGAGVTDGIFFNKDDGDALLDIQVQKDATTGQTRGVGIATVVADTFLTMAWAYDGISEVKYYVNDVQLGTLAATSAYLPDTELTVSFAMQNGEAVAKTMTLDYIFAAQER